MAVQILFVANVAEAFKELIQTVPDRREKEQRIENEHFLSMRALFWGGNNKAVITPFEIPVRLLKHNCSVAGFTEVINLYPQRIGISLCEAVRDDRYLWLALVDLIRKNPGIQISPYAATKEFWILVRHLREQNLSFAVRDVPDTSARWTSSYLDSKAGFHFEVSKLRGALKPTKLPDAFACTSQEQAIDIASWFYSQGRSCILKANLGESGWGLKIMIVSQFRSTEHLVKAISETFGKTALWTQAPILVEEFIEADTKVAGGSPSVEVLITRKGPKITYVCGQLLGVQRDFLGVEMGRNIVDGAVARSLSKTAQTIGKRYHELGYRGFFDLDFVAARDGGLYLVETNMRRTGGTHVFDFACEVLGRKWLKHSCLLSQDRFCYAGMVLDADAVFAKLNPILFPIQSKRRGVIITALSPTDPVLGFLLVASSRKELHELRTKLVNNLNTC